MVNLHHINLCNINSIALCIIALGDSNCCGAGHTFDVLLQERRAMLIR